MLVLSLGIHQNEIERLANDIRLEAPQVSVTTRKEGRPLSCRWYGEITVKPDR